MVTDTYTCSLSGTATPTPAKSWWLAAPLILTGTSFTYLKALSPQRDGARERAAAIQPGLGVPVQLAHAQLNDAKINFSPLLIVAADGKAGAGSITGMRESG